MSSVPGSFGLVTEPKKMFIFRLRTNTTFPHDKITTITFKAKDINDCRRIAIEKGFITEEYRNVLRWNPKTKHFDWTGATVRYYIPPKAEWGPPVYLWESLEDGYRVIDPKTGRIKEVY